MKVRKILGVGFRYSGTYIAGLCVPFVVVQRLAYIYPCWSIFFLWRKVLKGQWISQFMRLRGKPGRKTLQRYAYNRIKIGKKKTSTKSRQNLAAALLKLVISHHCRSHRKNDPAALAFYSCLHPCIQGWMKLWSDIFLFAQAWTGWFRRINQAASFHSSLGKKRKEGLSFYLQ